MVSLKRFAWTDALVAALLLAAGAAAIPFMTFHSPAAAIVRRDNAVIGRYPLSADAELSIKGAAGPMVIRVSGGKIGVAASHCPRRLCRHSLPIGRPGQQIVCVPNRVIIEVEASDSKGVPDAVAR